MKTYRNVILSGIIAATTLGAPTLTMAQIPVTDAASIAQRSIELGKQLVEMKSQLEQMRQQYEALTGSSGRGGLLNDSIQQAANNFPTQWGDAYGDGSGSGRYFDDAEAMLSDLRSKMASMSPSQALDYARQQRQQKGIYDRVMTEQVYNDQMRELANMQELTNQIDTSTSMKEIADLQARIGTAQGTIQAQQQKLQSMAMLQQAQDKILEEQQNEANRQMLYGPAANGGEWQFPDVQIRAR